MVTRRGRRAGGGVSHALGVPDWGPLLKAAFPQPCAAGTPLLPAQRLFLAALVDNHALWEGVANPRLWLMEAGLPQDRDGCRQLLDPQ